MAVLPRGVSFVCADLIFKILKSLPTCIRERCWGFDNLVFEICNNFCWLAQETVLLIVEKHNGFIFNFLCGARVKIYIDITLSSADLC